MSLFSFFKHKKEDPKTEVISESDLELIAPVSGTLLPLEQVPDLVISEKLVGDGVAFIPRSSQILAPCKGVITRILPSKTAFAIRHKTGIEIYITYGVGTNTYKGDGFTKALNVGDEVDVGTPIITFNPQIANENLESTATSMIVINSSANIARVVSTTGKVEAGKTPCAWVILNQFNTDVDN